MICIFRQIRSGKLWQRCQRLGLEEAVKNWTGPQKKTVPIGARTMGRGTSDVDGIKFPMQKNQL